MASKRVASRLSLQQATSLDEDGQVKPEESLDLDHESQQTPEARSRTQTGTTLPAVDVGANKIKRTHEIHELVSREELALLLSDEFLFGSKIEIDAEKAK